MRNKRASMAVMALLGYTSAVEFDVTFDPSGL